jgi:uncharacterized protein Yka (UPF0111/DUF47 family)
MFNWFQALLPRTSDFFAMFEQHAATLVAAADALSKLVDGGKPHEEYIAEIHRREHEADDIIRQVLISVRRTFLTPFDRGAITSLIGAMDDAIDEMQSTARAVDVYELRSFEPEMREMVAMIAEAAALTAEAMPLLRNISRNGPRIHEITEKVVRLEGEADRDDRREHPRTDHGRDGIGRVMQAVQKIERKRDGNEADEQRKREFVHSGLRRGRSRCRRSRSRHPQRRR